MHNLNYIFNDYLYYLIINFTYGNKVLYYIITTD